MTIIQEEIMNKIIKDYNNGNSPDKLSKIYTDYSPYIIRENLKHYGVFKIPTETTDKFIVSVDKYDMNNNYIKTYKTIYEAENDSISNKSEIYRVASGDRKSSRNEKWKFTKTA